MRHAQLQRRFPAERARHLKRLPHEYGYGDSVNFGLSFILTGPTTITQIQSVPSSPPTVVTNVIISDSTTDSDSETTTTSSTSTVPLTTSSAQTTTVAVTPTSSITPAPPSSTSGGATPSGVALPPPSAGAALGSRPLPTGAIVGTVIAVFLISMAVVMFFIRKRFVQNRQKRTFNWKAGLFNNRFTANAKTHSSFEAAGVVRRNSRAAGDGDTSPGFQFATAQSQALANQRTAPTPPPMSYNNTNNNPPLVSAAVPNPPRSGRTAPPPALPESANVKYTFIPTLPDELSISTGEVVRVLAEFDDGWGLCVNGRREQGMVPLECLDRGTESPERQDGRDFSRNSRRASSLAASANPGRRY